MPDFGPINLGATFPDRAVLLDAPCEKCGAQDRKTGRVQVHSPHGDVLIKHACAECLHDFIAGAASTYEVFQARVFLRVLDAQGVARMCRVELRPAVVGPETVEDKG